MTFQIGHCTNMVPQLFDLNIDNSPHVWRITKHGLVLSIYLDGELAMVRDLETEYTNNSHCKTNWENVANYVIFLNDDFKKDTASVEYRIVEHDFKGSYCTV